MVTIVYGLMHLPYHPRAPNYPPLVLCHFYSFSSSSPSSLTTEYPYEVHGTGEYRGQGAALNSADLKFTRHYLWSLEAPGLKLEYGARSKP